MHTDHIYIQVTCKRHVEKGITPQLPFTMNIYFIAVVLNLGTTHSGTTRELVNLNLKIVND